MPSWTLRSAALVCSGLLASSARAADIDGVVSMDVSRFTNKDLERRSDSDSIPVDLDNRKSFYQVTVAVGTPQQSLQLVVDTGSSDTWVTTDQFNAADSSTFAKNETAKEFSIGYGDSSKATGYWGTDNFQVGSGATLNDVSFAVVNSSTGQPILGIGLTQGESTVTTVTSDGVLKPTYNNIPILLKDQGLIKRVAYSLWLNDKNAGKGQLLMGGVDHSKYEGSQLGLVPIVNDGSVPSAKNPTTLTAMLHGVATNTTEYTTSIPVLLDSGSTMSYLPADLISGIASSLGASPLSSYYSVPCDIQGELTFDLSGLKLPVSLQDIIMSVHAGSTQYCVLSFVEHTAQQRYILGDNVLRNWYVVYDLESLEVGLAPSVLDATSSNVEAIESGIPNGKAAPSYSSTVVQDSVGSASISPSSTQTSSSAPVSSAPVSSAPVSSAPVSSAPVSSAPVSSAPVSSSVSSAITSSMSSAGQSSSSMASVSSSVSSSASSSVSSVFSSASASSAISSSLLVANATDSILRRSSVSNANNVKSSMVTSYTTLTSLSFRNSSSHATSETTSKSSTTSAAKVHTKNNAAAIGASKLAFLAWYLLI